MENFELGTKLIAKTDCKMHDGSGNALIVDKQYEIIYQSKKTEEIAVKSELFEHHFFSTNAEDGSYWQKFFNLIK